ncbi:Cell wall-binding protein YocH precursor [compost metagenome]
MRPFTLVLILLLIFNVAFAGWVRAQLNKKHREEVQKLEAANTLLQTRINKVMTENDTLKQDVNTLQAASQRLTEENATLINKVHTLTSEVNKLQSQLKESQTSLKLPPGLKVEKVVRAKATAYGASVRNGGAGTGKTALGTKPIEGTTVAVDPNKIPLGTKLYIVCDSYPEVNGIYEAQDTGSAIKGNKIDIYFNDNKRAKMLDFGNRQVKVYVLEEV